MSEQSFNQWLDTFIEEKQLPDETFQIEHNGEVHYFENQLVFDLIRKAPKSEQEGFKSMIVKLDFLNANINDYLKHLAKGYIALHY